LIDVPTLDMSLKTATKHIDGSIPVQAFLYQDEDLQLSQDGVGVYDGHGSF
jgi:ESCRT-II complex subunit VPS36